MSRANEIEVTAGGLWRARSPSSKRIVRVESVSKTFVRMQTYDLRSDSVAARTHPQQIEVASFLRRFTPFERPTARPAAGPLSRLKEVVGSAKVKLCPRDMTLDPSIENLVARLLELHAASVRLSRNPPGGAALSGRLQVQLTEEFADLIRELCSAYRLKDPFIFGGPYEPVDRA